MVQEELQQRELPRRQVQRLLAHAHRVRGGIQLEIPRLHDGWPLDRSASDQGSQPGRELSEVERLGEVVVRSRVESEDPVVHGATGRQHEDRRKPPARTQLAAHLEPVIDRQHHVQDDRVVVVLRPEREGVLTVARDVDRIALTLESTADRAEQLRLILDDKDLHDVSLSLVA